MTSRWTCPQIAERLDVDYVLEGSVRESGEQVRITAQLIDAPTNVARLVEDLRPARSTTCSPSRTRLRRPSRSRTAGDSRWRRRAPARPRPNVAAYESFLHGRFFHHRRSPGDIERATEYYKKAVELDPQYARAWAALAGTYFLILWQQSSDADDGLLALHSQAALRAVELDPELALAQARLAQYYYFTRQHEKGDEHLRLAIALDPDDPLVLGFRSSDAVSNGDIGAAVDIWARIVAQDPLVAHERRELRALSVCGRATREVTHRIPKGSRTQSGRRGTHRNGDIARVLVLLGRYDEASAGHCALAARKLARLLPRAPVRRPGTAR